MSRCNYCGVEIADKTEHCPLCNGVLDGDDEGQQTYPDLYNDVKKANIAYRIMMFVCVLGIMGTVVGSIILDWDIKWGVVTAMCIMYAMWMLYVSFNDRAGYRVRFLTGAFFAVILIIIIDVLIGYKGWSLNYILPSGIILVDIGVFVIMMVNRRNWQSYIVFQIAMVFICIIPLIFIVNGIVTQTLLSVIAILLTVVECIGTIMIGGPTAQHELKRRFHIR